MIVTLIDLRVISISLELDKILPAEASAVVISTGGKGEEDTRLKQGTN